MKFQPWEKPTREDNAMNGNQAPRPEGRLILGMEAARDHLLATALEYQRQFEDPSATFDANALWVKRRDAYEVAAVLLDAKIKDLKKGTHQC